MMKKYVGNLEFQSYCTAMTIHGYKFTRVEEYRARVALLQHKISVTSELKILPATGQLAITAYVELPRVEDKPVFEWANRDPTPLLDIVLLLSIFTGRDIFLMDSDTTVGIFEADPRVYEWGGILQTSIPYKASHSRPINSENWEPAYNVGVEEGINQVYTLIRSEAWQREYRNGYFLFLARMAFRQQPLESAFTQCWTIWEHLFSVHNSNWLSEKDLQRTNAAHKIAFILTKYALINEVDPKSGTQIESWGEIRNRLIHFGRFPERNEVMDDAILFIRLTEFIIAKILNLLPSEMFDTTDKLKEFLNKKPSAR